MADDGFYVPSAGPQLCVGGLAWRDDQLLLVRRGHGPAGGHWWLPGGPVQFGQSLAEALVVACQAQTGLDVVVDDLAGWAEQLDPTAHSVTFNFDVTVLDDAQRIVAGVDIAEVRWVDLSELHGLRLGDGLIEFLDAHGLLDDVGDDIAVRPHADWNGDLLDLRDGDS